MGTAQGATLTKTALAELGIIPHPTVRLPLVEPAPVYREQLAKALQTIALPA
jgi:4-hydroxy-tetrahydrodipicolinate synthase